MAVISARDNYLSGEKWSFQCMQTSKRIPRHDFQAIKNNFSPFKANSGEMENNALNTPRRCKE
jgi:hypothetical protein